jgi:hypothetical protein
MHQGITITPSFELIGDTLELSFYAAPWNKDEPELYVTASNPDIHLADNTFTMQQGQWTHFVTQIWGTGASTLTFTPDLRFFLDEVLIRRVPDDTAIRSIQTSFEVPVSYSLDGLLLKAPASGIIIRRFNDGTVRKEIRF